MERIKVVGKKNVKGQDILLFRLTNSSGNYVEILTLGATIVSVVVPDRTGKHKNIVLRYPAIESYAKDTYYLGSTIGRVANRIRNASFYMDGILYELDKNDGGNHCNHGGYHGLNRHCFESSVEGESLVLRCESPDGEGGFPGHIRVEVMYRFTDENELVVDYRGKTDRKTPLNLTNHAYFNLSNQETIWDHQLQIFTDQYLEMDGDFLPTGRTGSVVNTFFDFRRPVSVGKWIDKKREHIRGYNSYFTGWCKKEDLSVMAMVSAPDSGIYLRVKSSMPGILFYTGDYLSNPFRSWQGLCLEAQYPPDGLNQPDFDAKIIHPHELYSERIVYQLGLLN